MIDKDLCDRIKKARDYLQLNQVEFAKRLGTTQSRISMIENHREEPSKTILKNIIRISDISGTWLLTGEGDMFRKKSMENKSSINQKTIQALQSEIKELKKTLRLLEAENNKNRSKIIDQLEKLSTLQDALLQLRI